MTAELTVLNSMAGPDLRRQTAVHRAWHLRSMDLKDGLFGKSIGDLDDDEIDHARRIIADAGLSVACVSSVLFGGSLADGEAAMRDRDLARVGRLVEISRRLDAPRIRLLAPHLPGRQRPDRGVGFPVDRFGWVIGLYRQAIDRILAAGREPLIENEVGDCILGAPGEIVAFFEALDRPGGVRLIWDVQNMWHTGTFPDLAGYRQLRPWIGMLHLKGGRCDSHRGPLRWASSLSDASWPVADIVAAAVSDGVSPILCLNPSHGEYTDEWPVDPERDLAFVRAVLAEIEP